MSVRALLCVGASAHLSVHVCLHLVCLCVPVYKGKTTEEDSLFRGMSHETLCTWDTNLRPVSSCGPCVKSHTFIYCQKILV